MMKVDNSLSKSINYTISSLAIFQTLFILIVTIITNSAWMLLLSLIFINIIYHILMLFALKISPNLFVTIPEGIKLKKINLANKITLLRMSSLPNILFLIILQQRSINNKIILPLLIISLTIVFLTDLFDGYISRKNHLCTKLGAMLDSTTDYLILFVITIAFHSRGIIQDWIFIIVLTRGLSVMVGEFLLQHYEKKGEIQSTYWGKVSIFAIMVLFALELTKLASFPSISETLRESLIVAVKSTILPLELIASAIIIISLIDKGYHFYKRTKAVIELKKKD